MGERKSHKDILKTPIYSQDTDEFYRRIIGHIPADQDVTLVTQMKM